MVCLWSGHHQDGTGEFILERDEWIISETEEESQEKNLNQRPLEESSRIEGMPRKLN